MSDSPLDRLRHRVEGVIDEVVDPQKRASNVAGLRGVFSEEGVARVYEATQHGVENARRLAGLPTEMDGHRERLDVRLREVEHLSRPATLDRSERAFLAAYQHATSTELIREAEFLSNEGHGAGLFVTWTDRAAEEIRHASPLAGKGVDWVLDKADWDQIKTVFDPAHAKDATNWQGLCACVAVAADLAPVFKPEQIAEKGVASAERHLAKALEHEAEAHPERFLREAEKATEWAGKHMPEPAKKIFDKALEKMTEYAKHHGKIEAAHGIDLTEGDRGQLGKMANYTGNAVHTGKVIIVDSDVVIQRVGDGYVRYNRADLGGHAVKTGSIETLGNGVAVPLLPKLERAIERAESLGGALPAVTNLQQREPGRSYSGQLRHLEGDTYFMSVGRGEYVVFDGKADLHGRIPPPGESVTIGGNGTFEPPAANAHARPGTLQH